MISRNPLLLCLAVSLITVTAAGQEPADPPRQKRTPIYTEQGATACLRCHSGEQMRAVQSGAHFKHENDQAPAAKRFCESCHGAGSIHVSRAHGGKGFPALTRFGRGADKAPRAEQLAACLACHGAAGSAFKAVGFVGSPHDRPAINCSTCHTMHAATDPIHQRDQQVAICNRCHRRDMAEHPRTASMGDEMDTVACSTCHAVHAAALVSGLP